LKREIEQFKNNSYGAIFNAITVKTFDLIRVPLPPKDIQEKIVSEIEVLEAKEAKIKSEIERSYQKIAESINDLFSQTKGTIRIKDFFEINKLTSDPRGKFKENPFIYVDIDSVGKGTGKISFEQKLSGNNAPSRARRVAENGSAIISTVRPYLKGFAYISEVPKDTIFSTGFAVIKSISEDSYSTKLLYYFFMYSSDLMQQMEERMRKAAYPSINKEDIDNFQLPKIKIQVQQSTVSRLVEIENKIATLESEMSAIPQQKESTLRYYL
jgi:restriction endonuclease S subunit